MRGVSSGSRSIFRRQQLFARSSPSSLSSSIIVRLSSSSSTNNGNNEKHIRPDVAFILEHYKIHRREKDGSKGSSREYLLLPPDVYVPQVLQDPTLPAAALFAHRNILFGARSFHGYDMEDVCRPLVKAAIEEAETIEHGQQPQAVANLKGLSDWVAEFFENDNIIGSQTLARLQQQQKGDEAVRAIATGIPRPGHSVVGQGTFRDGQKAWEDLAKEYTRLGLSEETNLYEKFGGNVVAIEHMADQSPENMKSAGGAIARLFFS
ncbi:hypothetical protein FRACYDRAFT_178284 [Fragilariopsis cylindrus CCMP1102]|uniref:Uncharacterized protein n=1 Tax=Fragilariopsis cylindrus CCMP1102 TaxID=635003 RepID=A0A1E7FW91_9STRA|nr:hypothetical protein FRACYDRAFT_178284 [Fragilariopsis cylindrus CCMP1102]|eukprot:OEU22073.1 hypothetical protein FRACYDRAFT_178284 [Fragilariopsis cylindrus CCMP1102]